MKNIVVYFCIFLMLNACIKYDLSKDEKYNFYLSSFGNELTAHFPREYESTTADYAYSMSGDAFNTQEMHLTLIEVDKQISEVLTKYKDKKIYSDTDSCIVVLNDFISENELKDVLRATDDNPKHFYPDPPKNYKSKIYKGCKNKYQVIPNFWDGYYSSKYKLANTRSKLNEDFKFIIIDSQFGEGVWSSKLNSQKTNMPEPVKHGYSRGIAFNEKEKIIIYWVILW
jgi:hypothetical protein